MSVTRSWIRRGNRTLAAAWLLASGMAGAPEPTGELRVAFSAADRELLIPVGNATGQPRELRLETDGLTRLELGDDVGEPGIIYLPPPPGVSNEEEARRGAENVFFFNELTDAAGWELVARFDDEERGTWKLNGRFSPLGGAIEREIVIPVAQLEPGENLLHLRSATLKPPGMYFRRTLGAETSVRIRLSSPEWGGSVTLWERAGAGAWQPVSQSVITPRQAERTPVDVRGAWWDDRTFVENAALAVGRNLLAAQVRQPGSFFEGGFHLVYDPTHRAHRMAHWLWSWGPAIDLLFALSHEDFARTAGLAGKFRVAAIAAAERSLQFGMLDATHPAYGVSTVRWEPSRATPNGWAEYISTADSLFLAGWGWMSAHRETGRPEFLERTKLLVSAAERLMKQYPVVPQDWIVERNDWTPHTLDESVFGIIGFRRLYQATHSSSVAAAGKRFLDSHLEHMGREGGLLARGWMREEDREIWDPDIKGHAWVFEGYLDAHRLSGDPRYLQLADELAKRVLECQAPEGRWTFLFVRPKPGDPSDDKGTAIWAYLLYELHRSTKNPEHLAAARRALGWCLRHQYRGEDPNLDGGLFNPNSMAYVRRRPLTVLYGTTFLGMALLEELKLRSATGSASRARHGP